MKKGKILLGCTSVRELLDTDAEAVLWINDYYRNKMKELRLYGDTVEHFVMPKFWQTQEEFCHAKDYCLKIHETIIARLARQMDLMQHSYFGERGWNIIIGDWLRFYIEGFYDKYVRVKYAIENYPDIYMKKNYDWYMPRGECLPNNEILQEQVYRDVYDSLSRDGNTANMRDEHYKVMQDIVGEGELKRDREGIRRKVVERIQRLLCRKDVTLYFHTSYLPLSRTTLEILSRGRIRRLKLPDMESPSNEISIDRRRVLKREADYGDKFVNLVYDCLWRHIPMAYVEDFQDYYRAYQVSDLKVKTKVLDSITVHGNFLFKIFVADAVNHGGKLEMIQHGGNYCIEKYVDTWEFEIADKYYTWGDGFIANNRGNMYAMPMPKIVSVKIKKKNKKEILYVGYEYPPYVPRLGGLAAMKPIELYGREEAFFQMLEENIRKVLRVRCYHGDMGWNRKEVLTQKFPWMRFDYNHIYYESMSDAKLVVTSLMSTTWMEAIACDIPVIVFVSEDSIVPDENAVEILKDLRRMQVLFSDSEDAADFINKNEQRIEEWWNEPERKAVVNRFRKMYASHDRFSKWKWIRELLKESKWM